LCVWVFNSVDGWAMLRAEEQLVCVLRKCRGNAGKMQDCVLKCICANGKRVSLNDLYRRRPRARMPASVDSLATVQDA